MLHRLVGCIVLVGLSGASGCMPPKTSPRLEELRPLVKRGAKITEFPGAVESLRKLKDAENADPDRETCRVIYELDGSKFGMILRLTFLRGRLTEAVVLKRNRERKFVDEDEKLLTPDS